MQSPSPESTESPPPPQEENFLSDEGFAESSTIERDEKDEDHHHHQDKVKSEVIRKNNQEFDDLIKFHQRQTCFEILPTNQLVRSHSRDLQPSNEKNLTKSSNQSSSSSNTDETDTFKKFRNKYNLQSDDSVGGIPQAKTGLKLRAPSKLLMGRSKRATENPASSSELQNENMSLIKTKALIR